MAKGSKRKSTSKAQRGANEGTHPNAQTANVPPKNYLARGPAAVRQSHRETLNWAYVPSYRTLAGSTYSEFFQICLNNPYDPDVAVGGTSAHGFSKYMAFYSKCFVLGARIKVKGVVGQISGPGCLVGTSITTSTTASAAAVTDIQNGYVKYDVVYAYPDRFTHEMAVDVGRFLDKPDVLDDASLFCTSGGGPLELVIAHIWASNYSTSAQQISYVVEVEYECVFTDPIPFT